MKTLFADDPADLVALGGESAIRDPLEAIAVGTDCRRLVVAVYVRQGTTNWHGVAHTSASSAQAFCCAQGKWRFVRNFDAPEGLPASFALIRIAIPAGLKYPRTERDCYGWEFAVDSFSDLLGCVFAHELHHFRRHHLGLHPGEGEQSATKWGLARAKRAGFSIQARRVKTTKRKRRTVKMKVPTGANPTVISRLKTSMLHLSADDLSQLQAWTHLRAMELRRAEADRQRQQYYDRLRALPGGAALRIVRRARDDLSGQIVKKVRNLRGSKRMEIEAPDGTVWRYPMTWLEVPGDVTERRE